MKMVLLLTFAFETLKTIRDQFKTSKKNIRSQKAIQKISATYEGTFRNERINQNGTKRNSPFYSIIDDEWNSVKSNLTQLLKN